MPYKDPAAYAAYQKEYRRRNAAKAVERANAWSAAHRDRHRAHIAAWQKRNLPRHAERMRRRNVMMRNGVVERVDPTAVAQRDRWICHLCGEAVTLGTFSLDHVVPVSKGGAHTYENIKLAHRICNSRRGAKPLADYMKG